MSPLIKAAYVEVPISAAERIAEEFGKDQVIIVTWDDMFKKTHVTTYGRDRRASAAAAQGGNLVWDGDGSDYPN